METLSVISFNSFLSRDGHGTLAARVEWEGYGLGCPLLSKSEEGAPLQVDGDARGPGAAANL